MSVIIKEVNNKADFKNFVKFPFQIYKNNQFWIPPIIADEIKALDSSLNPNFEYCTAKFWLAYKNDKIVGRIGGIINHKYNEKTAENFGRFSRFEFIDDLEVSEALIKTVETWCKEQKMDGIMGPLGFNNLDGQGMLIEGFDHLPSVGSIYHHPYYLKHLEKLGYLKEIDWVEFRLTIGAIPDKALKMNEMIKTRYKLKVISFQKTKELLPYGKKLFEVFNTAFENLFSVVKLNDKMIDYYIERYLKMLNPKFVKLIEDDEKNIVAFIIGLPSLSKAFQKANGKLFPFGFLHLLKALKKPEVVDLLLTGIDPRFQSKGYSAVLITELQKVMVEHGVKYVETTGIFETNHEAINHWKNYDNIQHKRKRCFKKVF